MASFYHPVAVFYSADGGEYTVRRYAGKYQVIGPWTVDAVRVLVDRAEAISDARRRAEPVLREWVEPGPWKECGPAKGEE